MPGVSISWPAPPERRRLQRLSAPGARRGLAARERARRRMVALTLLVYLLAIFEGALRKWAAPQWSQALFFVRDPFVLLAYATATAHGLWPRRSLLFGAALAFAAVGALLPVLQSIAGGFGEMRALLAGYGWRSYFLYIPLAFLVGNCFQRDDLVRVVRWTLWLAVPAGALVAVQFASAPGSPINVGIASDDAYQFKSIGLSLERVRPQGFFASGAGQQVFVASAFALLVAALLSRERGAQRVARWPTLLLGGAGVLTCIGLSGSRGTVLQCALVLVAALAVGTLGRGVSTKARAFGWPLAIGVGALLLYPVVFPAGFESFVQRWTAADAAESRSFSTGIFGRALYGLVDFLRLFEVVPALGYGLGYGGNAAITLRASVDGVMPGLLAEADFSRHMVDLGPAIGLAFIGLRLALALALATRAVRATRLTADPLPLLLLSFAGYLLVFGQLTGQGTITFYGWFFAGLTTAAALHPPAPVRRAPPTSPPGRIRT